MDDKMQAIMARMNPAKLKAHMKSMYKGIKAGAGVPNVKPKELKAARQSALAEVFSK